MFKKVSIIIPCYNQEKFISEAMESALNQTYKNVEIVVINDASKDNSSEVIQKYANQHTNIIFLDEKENKGVVKSRNLAISKCSGDYILPLDGDDKIEPTFCEKAVKILDSDEEIRIVYSRTQFFGHMNKEFKLESFNPNRIMFNNCIPNTAMYRKSDFVSVGGYQDYMKDGWEDWDLWLSILENAPNKEKCAYRINEILFLYRIQNVKTRNSFSSETTNKLLLNLVFNHKNLCLYNSCFSTYINKYSPHKLNKKNKMIKKLVFIMVVEFFVILALCIANFL